MRGPWGGGDLRLTVSDCTLQDKKQPKEEKYHKLAEQILESELMYPLLMNLHLLPFEVRLCGARDACRAGHG